LVIYRFSTRSTERLVIDYKSLNSITRFVPRKESLMAKVQPAQKRTWARTGALILFLITGVLLVASLHDARSEQLPGAQASQLLNSVSEAPATTPSR
jgi:hypothetical protein